MTPSATKVKTKQKRRTFHNIERPILAWEQDIVLFSFDL